MNGKPVRGAMVFKDRFLQAEYADVGFTKTNLLSALEVEQLLDEIAKLRPGNRYIASDATKPNSYHITFMDPNRDYRRGVFQLVNQYFSKKLRLLLPEYYILNASLIVKPPGGGVFQVHHDWSYLADITQICMTVWCPLIDANLENGTIHVVPKSNQLVHEYRAVNTPCYFDDIHQAILDHWLQPVPTQAGDALFWDNHMIHWSGCNFTNSPRIAVQITCAPKQFQPVFFFYDQEFPSRLEIYEADQQFWLNVDYQDLCMRQPQWTSLGFIPNVNQRLTEAQFSDLLWQRAQQ